jgi:hypothetical protein
MKINITQVTKLSLTELDRLDPVTVIVEDFSEGKGQITISCYGKAWTSYWGGIGKRSVSEFFCSCDEHYIAKNLSDIDSEIYDIDAIRSQAGDRGIEVYRDDPWNDYEFLSQMYGSDPYDWHHDIPKRTNPDYQYLCRIIKAVQEGLKNYND